MSSPMERLRQEYFGSPVDQFDMVSFFVTAFLDDVAVGMIRVTPPGTSVLMQWTKGSSPLPVNEGTYELTRAAVHRSHRHRRVKIFELLMIETMLRLRQLRADAATAAIEPRFVGKSFLHRLGFEEVGTPIPFHD